MILSLAATALFLGAAAFFAGAETGFYSVNPLRLRLRRRAGRRDAAVVHSLLDRMDETIMATLIGTNITLYAATAIATELWSAHERAELWATLTMTPVIFVLSEMTPKDLFRRKADTLTYRIAGFFDAFRAVVWPVTAALHRAVALFAGSIPAEDRRGILARSSPGYVLAQTRRREVTLTYQAALSAHAVRLLRREAILAMIPLHKTMMVRADLRGEQLRAAVVGAGRAQLPVFRRRRADVVGILDALDYASGSAGTASAAELARPAPRFRSNETTTAVLLALRGERLDMGLITDEHGTVIGIVTVRDLADDLLRGLGPFTREGNNA